MNFLKMTAVTLALLFSGTSYGSLMQWDVKNRASGVDEWEFAGYVQAVVPPSLRSFDVVPVTITDYQFEFTSEAGRSVVYSYPQGRFSYEIRVRSVDFLVHLIIDDVFFFSPRVNDLQFELSLSSRNYHYYEYGSKDSGSGALVWSTGRSVGVPEPSIIALFALGLVGIGFARRKIQS
jgi:hypothetical protein